MAATTPIGTSELRDPHSPAATGAYLREVWERRNYIGYVAMSELRARQITNVLGNLWHLLNPLMQIGVYYVIFGLLLETGRGTSNFLLFLSVGLFVFQFSARSITQGAQSIIRNMGLLKGIRFPRAVLPITSTITELLTSISNFIAMFVILLIGGETPRLTWLLFPVVIGVQLLFNLGASMIAARLTTHFRDMTQILPFLIRMLFYASGVIFDVDTIAADNPTLQTLFKFNPLYCFLSIARWTAFGGDLDLAVIASALVWSIAIVVVGFLFFRAAEDRYARD